MWKDDREEEKETMFLVTKKPSQDTLVFTGQLMTINEVAQLLECNASDMAMRACGASQFEFEGYRFDIVQC